MRHIIVGTAGHIDHGKSALVKALTGVDPDRLKEEQIRGITIDLGFAHLDLGDLQIGFVDVPGHEKFVKNMLAGVGGIDCVLLVVAADESIMPQTREHFDICRLLGIASGIIAITKTDLVDPELIELVGDEIKETVQGSFLENAPILPVSAKTGSGLEALKSALRTAAANVPKRYAGRLLRLPIDRAFSMRGFGTVVTGTMTSGCLRRDDEVELIPGGLLAKVRGIQVHGKPTDLALAGQRTAVNLQGVDLSQAGRGMTLTVPRKFMASQILDVRLALLHSARPLKNFAKVRFHHGTAEVLARVALMGQSELAPGNTALAQLRLDEPVFCLHGDAFIVRQFSPAATIGGGHVLNPLAAKRKTTDRQAAIFLQNLEAEDPTQKLPGLIALNPRQGMNTQEINAVFGLADPELTNRCRLASSSGKLVFVAAAIPILVLPEVIHNLKRQTLALVAEFHAQNPLLRGISREELRKRLYDKFAPDVFRYCLDSMSEEKQISVQEDFVSLRGREVQLTPADMRVRKLIEDLLEQAGYQPPYLSEIAVAVAVDSAEVRKICFWMIKEKLLIRVSDDLAYLQTTLERMKGKIRECYASGARFGVAEFKELFELSRKHAIPLLEYLDREHFTRRQGNERILL